MSSHRPSVDHFTPTNKFKIPIIIKIKLKIFIISPPKNIRVHSFLYSMRASLFLIITCQDRGLFQGIIFSNEFQSIRSSVDCLVIFSLHLYLFTISGFQFVLPHLYILYLIQCRFPFASTCTTFIWVGMVNIKPFIVFNHTKHFLPKLFLTHSSLLQFSDSYILEACLSTLLLTHQSLLG